MDVQTCKQAENLAVLCKFHAVKL